MPQATLNPTLNIAASSVDGYVKAIVALTGSNEPPVGEVTNPQMNAQIKHLLNYAYKRHQAELPVADLE